MTDLERAAQDEFIAWFVKNYPPRTIISDPAWHAPKIWRRAEHPALSPAPPAGEAKDTAAAALTAAQASLEEAKKDAERYRHCRMMKQADWDAIEAETPDDFDAAIDAARQGEVG